MWLRPILQPHYRNLLLYSLLEEQQLVDLIRALNEIWNEGVTSRRVSKVYPTLDFLPILYLNGRYGHFRRDSFMKSSEINVHKDDDDWCFSASVVHKVG